MTTMTADQIRERISGLRQAIDSGVLTIEHADTRTTYRTLNEMERVLSALKADLVVVEGRRQRRRGVYVTQIGKGL
jgi:flagellin-like hook-associated protein FlgL